MKFLIMLFLIGGSINALACETCSDSKEETIKVTQQVQLPTHVKVFTDFTCKYCRRGSKTFNKLIKKYGSLIEVEPVAYPLSKSGPAYLAAQFFESVKLMAPEKSLDYAQALYKSEVNTEENFLSIAKSLGIDSKKLAQVYKTKKIKTILTKNRETAKSKEILGVPGYLFNNNHVVVGARPMEFFEELFKNGEGC